MKYFTFKLKRLIDRGFYITAVYVCFLKLIYYFVPTSCLSSSASQVWMVKVEKLALSVNRFDSFSSFSLPAATFDLSE